MDPRALARRTEVPKGEGSPLLQTDSLSSPEGGRVPWRSGEEWTFLGKVPSLSGETRDGEGSIPGCFPFVRPPRGLVPFFGREPDTPKKGKDPIPPRRVGRSPLWRPPLPSDASASADNGPLDDRPCRTSQRDHRPLMVQMRYRSASVPDAPRGPPRSGCPDPWAVGGGASAAPPTSFMGSSSRWVRGPHRGFYMDSFYTPTVI